jgi:tRNA(adenine34) deaminase
MTSDEFWMQQALAQAQNCLRSDPTENPTVFPPDDVPVGAVCVLDGQVVGFGHNRREIDRDPTAHAEILALRAASQTLERSHLDGVTLYVTLEPCPMCAGAIWLSRIARLVFGTWDEKAGACGSVFDVPRDPRLNHRCEVRGGVLESSCQTQLRSFFASLR